MSPPSDFFEKIDPALLELALTHRSMTPGAALRSNERLEFLGDSVLGMVVCEHLYATYPGRPEGELARAKSVVVRKSALAEAAVRSGVRDRLRLSRAEEGAGGRKRAAILADAFEAFLAAVYLTCGYEGARCVVMSALEPELSALTTRRDWRDAKTVLQEIRQGNHLSAPVYNTVLVDGEPHNRTFTVSVLLDGKVTGQGAGKSKRDAELAAAAAALAGDPGRSEPPE